MCNGVLHICDPTGENAENIGAITIKGGEKGYIGKEKGTWA